MAEGFDIARDHGVGKKSGQRAEHERLLLRNLQFDIQADSGPDSPWSGAVRGFNGRQPALARHLEHPIFLRPHPLAAGEMNFPGNQYTISRGRH